MTRVITYLIPCGCHGNSKVLGQSTCTHTHTHTIHTLCQYDGPVCKITGTGIQYRGMDVDIYGNVKNA